MDTVYRPVGTTSLKVPPLAQGSGMLGRQTEAQGIRVIQQAHEMGIRFFDTAPSYGTEPLFKQALVGIPRADYVFSSKVGYVAEPDGSVHADFTREGVLRSLEGSLKRTGVDYFDILHIHDADDHYRQALDEVYPALADLRAQGVIKAVGAGMNQWEMLVDFAKNAEFDCFLLAGRYTLLEQTSLAALEFFRQKQISIFAAGIYNSGILATGPAQNATYNYDTAPAHLVEKTRQIEAICQRHGVPLPVAAMQFPTMHPVVVSVIIGSASPEQVRENIAALDYHIPHSLWHDLREAGLIDPQTPIPPV